jgi:hypothetical protein
MFLRRVSAGAATARRVLPHSRPAPPVPGREGAPKIQGHWEPGEDGNVATVRAS